MSDLNKGTELSEEERLAQIKQLAQEQAKDQAGDRLGVVPTEKLPILPRPEHLSILDTKMYVDFAELSAEFQEQIILDIEAKHKKGEDPSSLILRAQEMVEQTRILDQAESADDRDYSPTEQVDDMLEEFKRLRDEKQNKKKEIDSKKPTVSPNAGPWVN